MTVAVQRKERMKDMKKRRISIILTLMIAVVIAAGCITSASAVTRKTNVTKAGRGNTLVLFKGKYQYVPKSKILAKLNKIRKEACNEGIRDPRDESRKLKKSDYKPLKWSRDLEYIAQIRAAEAAMYMDHIRPNDDLVLFFHKNGVFSCDETLAWNANADILLGIDQWYNEKKDWVKNNKKDDDTGHYEALINPDSEHVGIGAFLSTIDYPPGAIAGEFSYVNNEGISESQAKAIGKCNQVIEVMDEILGFSVKIPEKIHIGKSVQGGLKMQVSHFQQNAAGQIFQVNVPVKPYDSVKWKTSKKNIATVSKKGKIKSVKPGKATISVSVSGRTFKRSVKIEGHKWKKKYTVDKKPTLAAKGIKSIHCSGCSKKKPGSTVSVPKLTLPKVKITKPKAAKKAITVKWKKLSKKNRKKIAGVEIQVSKSKKFSSAKTVKVKKTASTKKITKLAKKKKYFVRIRTWKKYKGKKYVSKWSAVKSVKTK